MALSAAMKLKSRLATTSVTIGSVPSAPALGHARDMETLFMGLSSFHR